MKIKYEFVTGEVVEIEVDDKWEKVIVELDVKEYNNNHAETRRHRTISVLGDEGAWLADEEPRTYLECAGHKVSHDDKRFAKAYSSLTKKQKALYDDVYIHGLTLKQFAERAGISQAAASQIHNNVKKTFSLFFAKP